VINGAVDIVLATLLGLAVLAVWLGCLAVLRLPSALDRVHAAGFVNIAMAVLVTVAGFVADGISGRSLKILLAMLILVGGGAVLSHATGRALFLRDGKSA
jgi:multicomponent Na+:H+ antiporter subunit G